MSDTTHNSPVADETNDEAKQGTTDQPRAAAEDRHQDSSNDTRPIEELTLLELVALFAAKPGSTWRKLRLASSSHRMRFESAFAPVKVDTEITSAITAGSRHFSWKSLAERYFTRDLAQLALFGIAVLFALSGSYIMVGQRGQEGFGRHALTNGAPFFWLALLVWLLAEFLHSWPQLKSWWGTLDRRSRWQWMARAIPFMIAIAGLHTLAVSVGETPLPSLGLMRTAFLRLVASALVWLLIEFIAWWLRFRGSMIPYAGQLKVRSSGSEPIVVRLNVVHPASQRASRIAHISLATIFSLLVWFNTTGNHFPPLIIVLWLISALLWALVFAPENWQVIDWLIESVDRLRRHEWRRRRRTIVAFALILLLGASFRLHRLEENPGEMTSDHVEIILDGYRVNRGNHMIFFPNLGGREPIHFYAVSLLASLPGFGLDFNTIKSVSVLESLLTLPILLCLGVEVFGRRCRQFGILAGLLTAALFAVSYWQSSIARLGMRIPLTALFTALLLVYLARAMRCNRRSDFVKAGLILGFSLYGYQASRMLPAVVVTGVLFALMTGKHTWRERREFIVNLAILVFVSLIVFLPMLHYWQEHPENFWMRASTRIMGDQHSNATFEEAIAPILNSLQQMLSNMRRALLMYNWEGDIAWFHGVPHQPAMDMFSGAFLILGLAAWISAMLRSRDPVICFIPFVAILMLLPTALSLAHPAANPSFTRASGSIPVIYLIAALPIATIAFRLRQALPHRAGRAVAIIFCVSVVLLANQQNAVTYFDEYPKHYERSTQAHRAAGRILRGFAESDGSYGNAFVLSLAHWWDHRAVGIEAGQILWDGNPSLSRVPEHMSRAFNDAGVYRLDPERDLLFFYPGRDDEIRRQLEEWFPNGRESAISTRVPSHVFFIYRVPALGEAGIKRFLQENA